MSILRIRYVGLDVHKRVVEACIVDAAGKVVLRERFALNRRTLELFARKFLRPADRVALEATTKVADSHPDKAFYEGKVCAAIYFAHNVLPGVAMKARTMQTGDRSALDIPDDGF